MIEISNLTKKYGKKVLFSDLSFKIGTGDMVAIIGKSGQGKTTLLNCISQLEPVDSGHVMLDHQILNKKTRRQFFKHKAGFLFQNFALIDNDTVMQNLKLVSSDKALILKQLDKFDIASLINKKIYALSGGEQQRVALARLFLKSPEYIFADEPTASLDDENSELVYNSLRELSHEGSTIVTVTHHLYLADKHDTILRLHDGRLYKEK